MTTELFYLVLVSLLGATLWVPYIVGVNLGPSAREGFVRPQDPARLPPWVHRAWRAHLNLLEQSLPFAALVLVAQATGVSSAATALAAAAFFWLRLAHAAGMISGWARFPVRPMIFTAGWLCILVLGWEVLRLG